jgi:hypothetical protein
MKPGDPVLDRQQVARSDFVLFLASQNSFNSQGIASAELSLAQVLAIRRRTGLGLVALEGFDVPDEYADLLFEHFAWRSRRVDIRRIERSIAQRITRDAKISLIRAPTLGTVWVSATPLQSALEYLTSRSSRTAFKLSAVLKAYEMNRLVEAIQSLNTDDRHRVADRLHEMFLETSQSPAVAREQAIYILGRMASTEPELIRDLKDRYPSYNEPFLFRGFHIAMSYGKEQDLFADYLMRLESESSQSWAVQRKINKDFHLLYYNGLPGALRELRTSISQGRPRNILQLNVFTLGHLSDSLADLRLLEARKDDLKVLGVSDKTIRTAITQIQKRRK